MPLFLSEEEFRLLSHDASAVAERADAAIRDLRRQVDTVRAEADAASIAAEQTCALVEQRYEALYAEFAIVRSENTQLSSSVEKRLTDIAEAQAEKHQLHLKAIEKDGETERLSVEVAETNKSKRQLLELLEQKDTEIREKNATIQTYLDKVVNLTDNAVEKEARLQDSEAELARLRARCSRLTQEKELLEKHNTWLNDELSSKVKSLVELRNTHMEVEAETSAKLADYERQINEYTSSLKRSNEKVAELELRVNSLEAELCSSKDAAAASEAQIQAELSTATKLAELYKERSEELSKKAGELEGVIKALEAHLSQVEREYKEKLEKEASLRKNLEKDATELKEKLEKCEAEIETTRKNNELSLISVSHFPVDSDYEELAVGEVNNEITYNSTQMLVPKVPAGISGTALAASLLRDGWSLAKMYEKYQEAADALRHEKWGRKNAEAVLERVLHEIEEKAEIILDERAEHERMAEAYSLMNQKLQQALSEHDNFDNTIRNLKSELKKCEREYAIAQNEISDLQKQVTVLLKECQDIQFRCGATQLYKDNSVTGSTNISNGRDSSQATADNLMTFRDISELVEQNVQLQSLVHRLTCQDENKEAELREAFQVQLQKATDEATAKVESVLKRSEEQGRMIESLHSAVAMYKRLYEEETKMSTSSHVSYDALPDGKKELMLLFEGSQEVSKKAHEQLAERARNLEEDLTKLRGELTSLRSDRDKRVLEANFARDKLDSLMKEIEHQRQEANVVSARNVELTQLLLDFQKRLRECSGSVQASEENCRKLSMELSLLKHEKEILISSEKKAADEVCSLSERVHRLQSSLDTIQSTEEVRENARAIERRKHEEHLRQVEREWAEAKKELQDERDRIRTLTHDKEKAIENSIRQVEEMRKELADAWRSVASAESRAAVAEARCSDLEARINSFEKKALKGESTTISLNETPNELWKAKDELERLKEESQANKLYMLQYKEIAHTNEVALKQIESAHEKYKAEAERLKEALEKEVLSLRSRVSELEQSYILKSEEAATAIEAKEKELSSLLAETSALKDENAQKMGQIEALEIQVSSLKEDLDREHSRWRATQDKYERQVNLHSETIRELTDTSKELSLLNMEVEKLREISVAQKTENDILKASLEKEKTVLQTIKVEAEKKYNELNEQNKMLHSRLESLHIRLADKERDSRIPSESKDVQAESELHGVISYLRHSKEIAETEITLLKQEKSRLQAQLEGALKASETAQTMLRSKSESSRAMLFKDEEFKSLQLQVREINLLRESNVQLREENKHNFEEYQKFRDEAQKAKMEAEKFEKLLKEKQMEFDASQKEVENLKMEISHLNDRISELVECRKNIDPAEYDRMRDELQQTKALIGETKVEMELAKDLAFQKQETISSLEHTLSKCQLELAEQEKKLSDALQVEVTVRQDYEKHKRFNAVLKKKNEALATEKEVLNKEKQGLLKQMEDLRSSRKISTDMSIDQDTKEKDTRIQMLEKTLESKRDELRKERENKEKEKSRRLKCEKAMYSVVQTAIKISGVPAAQFPFDDNWHEYLQLAEATTSPFVDDGQGTNPILSDRGTSDASKGAEGRQVLTQQIKQSISQFKSTEEKERESVTKPKVEVRKAARKLVRPRLERSEEPQFDIDKSGIEGSTLMEEEKTVASTELELLGDNFVANPPPTRKRMASSTAEFKEDAAVSDEAGRDVAPPIKKSKDSYLVLEVNVAQTALNSENADAADAPPPSIDTTEIQAPSEDMEADQDPLPNEEIIDTGDDFTTKEEVEGQQMVSSHATNNEEVHGEGDIIAEESSDKPKVTMELLDEGEKGQQTSITDDDDEKEEGELMSDEPEEQQEGSNAEQQRESTPSDGAGGVEETGDPVDVASSEVLIEKSENDAIADVVGSNKGKEQIPLERSQSPQKPSRLEGSPVNLPSQQSTSTVAETEEPKVGRTITISERAKQNALLRQARMAAQQQSRGRGRAGFRRDNSRGASRGGRGERG